MIFRSITVLSALASVLITALTGGFAGPAFWWMVPAWFAGSFAALFLLVFIAFSVICLCVDVSKPQEHDSPFYRTVTNLAVDVLITLFRVRIHEEGMEQVPESGRFLLVCNHRALADPGVLLHCFRDQQLAFISKQENKGMPFIGRLMHKIMCQLINRENDREALKTILKCIQLIKEDEVSIAVFPEGKIPDDNCLAHFRSGVFKIAQKTGVPIVVCTMKDTKPFFRNIARLKPTDVQVHLLKVISPQEYKGKTTVQLGEEIYEMMIADLGEEYRAAEA